MLVDLGRRFHEAKQQRYPFDADSCATFFEGLRANGILIEIGCGFICGVVVGQPSNAAVLEAHELFWWSEDGNGKALLAAFEEEAKARGCVAVNVSYPEEEQTVGRYLQRQGYAPETRTVRKSF